MAPKLLLLALAVFCAASAASEAPDSRITGGYPVTIQEFPYVAAVMYFYPGPQIYIQRCVGAIVSSWHVITSAFCFTGANLSNMSIRAGSTSSLAGGLLVNVWQAVLHPNYVGNPRQNDIAVITLVTPLPGGATISALFLPAQGTVIPDNASFKVVSWGFETPVGPQLENLRSITLYNVHPDVCRIAFANVPGVAITDSVICAASFGNVGTCFGDSGAPMAINNVLVGISSVYHECGTDNYPDVFTRISQFTNWIVQVAQPPTKLGKRTDVPVTVASV